MDIIFYISDQTKNTKIFQSKIFLQGELVQCREIAYSARLVISLLSIGFPIVTHTSKKVWFRDIERARPAEKFSTGNFLYFFPGQKCYK